MNKYITIAVFQYPHEAHMVKSKLESEGIMVFLKDELTVQSHNFLSNAVGGVKLQVSSADVEEANLILIDMGINPAVSEPDSGLGVVSWSEKYMDKIPLFKKWPPEVRLIFFLGLIMVAIALLALLGLM